jgi:hypothetical protein
MASACPPADLSLAIKTTNGDQPLLLRDRFWAAPSRALGAHQSSELPMLPAYFLPPQTTDMSYPNQYADEGAACPNDQPHPVACLFNDYWDKQSQRDTE